GNYQKAVATFERRWAALNEVQVEELRQQTGNQQPADNHSVKNVIDCFDRLLAQKESISGLLMEMIIRNVKGDAHRDKKDLPLELKEDKQLLFFLSEQLDLAY